VILEVEQDGEHSKSTEHKTEAIVVGQITNTLCPKPEPEPKPKPDASVQSQNEPELTPLVSNLINDASNICVSGIKGTNVADTQHIEDGGNENATLRIIDNHVVRPEMVQNVMQKMAHSTQSDESKIILNRPPNNPVTNKFSTYLSRTDNVGGILLTKDEDIVDGFISLFEEPKEESSNPIGSYGGCDC